ncbi:hypothetical protein SRRS_11840 [Sporomusa rhizae]|uniref:hypothetical protein n=1 Tax=Sporomusa rhizae TaxID=357999 RepID=UPI00352B2A23
MLKKTGVILLLAVYLLNSVPVVCESAPTDNEKKIQDNAKAKEAKAVLTFDKEVVRKMLLEDGYKENEIKIELNRFSKINQKLQLVLNAYLIDRTISSDFNVEGLTMKIIMEKYSCNFWNALSFMDSYIDDPERAKRLIDAPPFPYRSRQR